MMVTSELLDERLRKWICAQWTEAVHIEQVIPLVGGVSSSMYRLHLSISHSDQPLECVLRAVYPTNFLSEDVGILEREAEVLKQLVHVEPIGSPLCIAYDASGEQAGVPALLMSYIEGKVMLPAQPSSQWLAALAEGIAPLHRMTAHYWGLKWSYFPYATREIHQHPAFHWSSQPDLWRQLIRHIELHNPSYTPCFIHRDYHPTNVLWNDEGKVSGIVDWVNGCIGPAGIDVGHCRSNLVQLYGVQAANIFLEEYIQANPEFQYDPYWDIRCLLDMTSFDEIDVYEGWTALGFQGLTSEVIQQSIDHYVEDLVQLLHTNRYIK